MKQENYLNKARKAREPEKSKQRIKGHNSIERFNWSKQERRHVRRESVRLRELEWW